MYFYLIPFLGHSEISYHDEDVHTWKSNFNLIVRTILWGLERLLLAAAPGTSIKETSSRSQNCTAGYKNNWTALHTDFKGHYLRHPGREI